MPPSVHPRLVEALLVRIGTIVEGRANATKVLRQLLHQDQSWKNPHKYRPLPHSFSFPTFLSLSSPCPSLSLSVPLSFLHLARPSVSPRKPSPAALFLLHVCERRHREAAAGRAVSFLLHAGAGPFADEGPHAGTMARVRRPGYAAKIARVRRQAVPWRAGKSEFRFGPRSGDKI